MGVGIFEKKRFLSCLILSVDNLFSSNDIGHYYPGFSSGYIIYSSVQCIQGINNTRYPLEQNIITLLIE